MLVIRRQIEEAIVIDGTDGRITVRVLGIEGDRVKLGCEAMPSVNFVREELLFRELQSGENPLHAQGNFSPGRSTPIVRKMPLSLAQRRGPRRQMSPQARPLQFRRRKFRPEK